MRITGTIITARGTIITASAGKPAAQYSEGPAVAGPSSFLAEVFGNNTPVMPAEAGIQRIKHHAACPGFPPVILSDAAGGVEGRGNDKLT